MKEVCGKELCVKGWCGKELCVKESRGKKLCVEELCHKCHACHTRGAVMSPNATPAKQSDATSWATKRAT